MFVSSADRNQLLIIAPELRLAPLHALHDTSLKQISERGLKGSLASQPLHKKEGSGTAQLLELFCWNAINITRATYFYASLRIVVTS